MAKKTTTAGLAAEIGKRNPFDCPQEEAYLNLIRTYHELNAQVSLYFRQHGLTNPQFNVLRILHGHGKPVSVYQIADEMVTPQPDMPRLIVRMESKQLVCKTRCEKDRRVMWVELTHQGKAFVQKLSEPLRNLHQESLKHLSDEQLAQLNELLWLARNPNSTSDTPNA